MTAGPGDYGGQRRNMEHESMVRTLDAQARVVWPHERAVLERLRCSGLARVLDLCCGTGEITRRFRGTFRPGIAVGLDLHGPHLRRGDGPRVRGDAFRAPFADGTFDLVLVRHVLQAMPDPVALLREARRLLRPGGRVHCLAEDYAGLLFDADDDAVENHFAQVAPRFRPKGTDLFQGRRCFRHAVDAGFRDVRVLPILVDNRNADAETLAAVFRHWRDGYAATLASITGETEAEMRRRFDAMARNARSPERYCAWLLFCVTGRAP